MRKLDDLEQQYMKKDIPEFRVGDTVDVSVSIVETVDRLAGAPPRGSRSSLIRFVADRPGHDRRYAIHSAKIREQLGWIPRQDFPSGLERTVRWYLENRCWVEAVRVRESRRPGLGPDD